MVARNSSPQITHLREEETLDGCSSIDVFRSMAARRGDDVAGDKTQAQPPIGRPARAPLREASFVRKLPDARAEALPRKLAPKQGENQAGFWPAAS